MTNEEFIAVAKAKVFENYRDRVIDNFDAFIHPSKVFVTWYSKVLQNHKALLGVSDPNDQHYYEVTYNGDKGELYLDVYNKEENVCIKVNENER
ncbi:DUF6275 family protein [Limosilactobacillus reuteri]|nr:DUF6275 family protein [Limosilactobacillus reuteri]MCH5378655.1 DUF6275 family protein [Limosilactobacillus reuteri]OCW70350.1 hypothetical protein BBP14_10850 [Limosilactobacillus reuteri]